MASLPIRTLTHPKVPSRVIMDWIDRWKEVQSRHSHVAPSNTAACQCRQKIAVDVFRHSDHQASSQQFSTHTRIKKSRKGPEPKHTSTTKASGVRTERKQ